MDFYNILEVVEEEQAFNPYAAKDGEGNWEEGSISIDFLNNNFGRFDNATDMKANTDSEGLKKYFDYLVSEGKLSE